jgi:CheY-like chemotaxis protein
VSTCRIEQGERVTFNLGGEAAASATGPFDFSELFTVAVRRVLPQILAKGLSHSFDVRGPEVVTSAEPGAVAAGLHRLLLAVLDLIDAGFLVLDAETGATRLGKCYVSVKLGGTGRIASQQRITDVLHRLELTEAVYSSDLHRPLLRRATGLCPGTGAAIDFAASPSQGILFGARWIEPRAGAHDAPAIDVGHERAWVINEDALVCESLVRRLQRLGWATGKFTSHEHAIRQLRSMREEHTRPTLVVGVESRSFGPAQALQLSAVLPRWTHCIYALASGSATLLDPSALGEWEVAVRPLSPQQMRRLASLASHDRAAPTGDTRPAPLSMGQRPLVIVVDDDELNRIIASRMMQTLGYEAVAAAGGEQAIALCRELHPAVVLMDRNMQPLDGQETTRRLRELERRGEIAPCRIIAVTADTDTEARLDCVRAGMDGFVAKPLRVKDLQSEIHRVCAGCDLGTSALEALPS